LAYVGSVLLLKRRLYGKEEYLGSCTDAFGKLSQQFGQEERFLYCSFLKYDSIFIYLDTCFCLYFELTAPVIYISLHWDPKLKNYWESIKNKPPYGSV